MKKEACRLVRRPVAERGGLVWAIPDPGSALDEDFRMVEAIQQGIGSGLMPHLHLARSEQTAD